MSERSMIEWTDATWNPVTGCTKVSPGCDHCYAERFTERFRGQGSFAVVTRSEDRLYQPLRWRRPRRVFVNSTSDLSAGMILIASRECAGQGMSVRGRQVSDTAAARAGCGS